VDYHFVSHDEFMRSVGDGEFIEYVKCYGNMYGTPRSSVYDVLQTKDACILDIEYEGAYNVLHNDFLKTKAIGILILPPSIKRLRERLINRGSETEESLATRLAAAFNPPKISRYDHVLINRMIDESTDALSSVIKGYI
jgi:guanylate kinase